MCIWLPRRAHQEAQDGACDSAFAAPLSRFSANGRALRLGHGSSVRSHSTPDAQEEHDLHALVAAHLAE